MGKQRRAIDLLVKLGEGFFRSPGGRRARATQVGSQGQNMKLEQLVVLAGSILAKLPRDERPGFMVYSYCLKNKCTADQLEDILVKIGIVMVQKHNIEVEKAGRILDELLKRVVAIGRMQFGKQY